MKIIFMLAEFQIAKINHILSVSLHRPSKRTAKLRIIHENRIGKFEKGAVRGIAV
jgi:hypothetical protein